MKTKQKPAVRKLQLEACTPPLHRHIKTVKSVSLLQGIRELDEFGFSSEAFNPCLPPRSESVFPIDPKFVTSVHVSDLWSHRQQRQFLQQKGLGEAQLERERQQRLEIYLAQRNKQEGSHITDELYERIVAESDPLNAAKLYAAGRDGKLLKQLSNQVQVNTAKRTLPLPSRLAVSRLGVSPKANPSSMKRLDELFTRCDDTLTRTQTSKK